MTHAQVQNDGRGARDNGPWDLVLPSTLRHWALVILPVIGLLFFAASASSAPLRWWKGNLHTHTFWSDGDDFPESIVDWYKTNGYHFLALSDHNVIQTGERWLAVTNKSRQLALEKYRNRFGPKWVGMRSVEEIPSVRLWPLAKFRRLFEERERFLLIQSEEISDRYRLLPIHINATNPQKLIKGQGGTSVVDVIQRNVDAVLAQRRRTGEPMIPHVNHPNFGWAITAEELMQVRGEKFFEVYNGHPSVHNEGDTHHASTERMWDIMLAFRLSQLKLGPLYGLGVDDSHHYHHFSRSNSNAGRGWIVVRSARLRVDELIAAMEAGDFYASSGVRLTDVRRTKDELTVEIDAEPGVTYKTEFIGTLEGFDSASVPGPRPTNSIYAVTRLYSEQIGAVLAVAEGTRASYKLEGDELYVRAKVMSSKAKSNTSIQGDMEAAWTQPLVPGRK